MAIVAHVMAVFVKICWDKKWLEFLHFAVWGTVLGCLIIGVLNNGLFLLNVSPFWQQVIKGGVILLAVALDKMNANSRDSA